MHPGERSDDIGQEARNTCEESVLSVCAFLELEGPAVASDASANFFKDALLLCFPFLLASLLEDSVELFLGLLPPLLDGGDEVLFVGMAEVAGDVCVLEGLEGGEGGGGVEVGDGACECGGVDAGLGEQKVSGTKRMSCGRGEEDWAYARSASAEVPGRRGTRRRDWASIWSRERVTEGRPGRLRWLVRFRDALRRAERSAMGSVGACLAGSWAESETSACLPALLGGDTGKVAGRCWPLFDALRAGQKSLDDR